MDTKGKAKDKQKKAPPIQDTVKISDEARRAAKKAKQDSKDTRRTSPVSTEAVADTMQLHKDMVARAVRPNHDPRDKKVHTIIVVGDEAYVREDKLVTDGAIQGLCHASRKVFGPENGNDVRICTSPAEAIEIVEKIEGSDWTNTFVYMDSRIKLDGSEEKLKPYVRTSVVTQEDCSVLMAAPVSGYSAYSQLYATFIERVTFYRRKGHGAEQIVMNEEIIQLAESMAKIVESMTGVRIDKAQILELVTGITEILDGKKSVEEFRKEYHQQHEWNLPPVKAADWNQIRDFLKEQTELVAA